jgi:hypothetical protein
MTTAAIRKQLINYIADADDKKIKGMYMLFEDDIHNKDALFELTDEDIKILDKEREKHVQGKSKSYTWDAVKKIVRSKKAL